MIEWHDVDSTNIKRIAWIADDQLLIVEFRSGGIYAYEQFNEAKWNLMLEPKPSYGEWFHNNVLVAWGFVGIKLQDPVVRRAGVPRRMFRDSIEHLKKIGLIKADISLPEE
jgi:hypothetical protein